MAKVLGNLEIDNGNLGVNTSPSHTLHVASAGDAEILAQRSSGAGVLVQSQAFVGVVGTNTNHKLYLKTNSSTRLAIDTSGNVGIGTSSPSYKLHVVGNSYIDATSASATLTLGRYTGQPTIKAGTDDSGYLIMDSSGGKLGLNWYSGDDISLANGGGNVGIGTTSPDSKLSINTSSGQEGIKIRNVNSQDTFHLGHLTSEDPYFQMKSNSGVTQVLLRLDGGSSYINTGNVGIGTSSPAQRLTVVDNNNTLQFGEHGTSDVAEFKIIADEAHDAAIYFGDTVDNVRGGIYYDTSLNNMQFRGYNNATRMIINSNGAVGIGTGTPAQKLDVSGNIQTSGRIDFSNANVHITRNGNELQLSGYSGWRFYDMQGTSTRMFLSQTGSLGIGTDAPDEKLHIVGDLKVDSDLPRIYLTDSSHNPDYSIVNNNGNFAVFDDTNSAYRIYVNSAGNVGIGTSLPAALLDVNGTAQMSTGITENVHYVGSSIQHWGDSGTGLYFETDELRFYTGGAEEMRLENDGDLHVDGDVIAYSTTVSDERLKDDIQTIDNACKKVCSLRGVEYTWNNGSRKGQREIGVIAQEVEKVIPEIVREKKLGLVDDEVYKTVDYEKLVAVLIEANKELCDRVSKLESKLDGITE